MSNFRITKLKQVDFEKLAKSFPELAKDLYSKNPQDYDGIAFDLNSRIY